jgi:glutathione synthase/RimK-type ligase-like ATP-grasp enzyme
MSKKIGLLTCDSWRGLLEKETEFAKAFNEFDATWNAQPVVWNDPTVDWQQFDVLIFRTIWDYYLHAEAFNVWLDKIEKLGIKTFNTIDTIRRNHHKFYLKDLSKKGVKIVPTQFLARGSALDLSKVGTRGWKKAILKPAISAGSHETRLFEAKDIAEVADIYQEKLDNEDLLLQPFIKEIKTSGEVSLIFFNKKFSHAIVKKPVRGDFRIQVQFGGQYQAFEPDTALLEVANNIVHTFTDAPLLYARVDGIVKNGQLQLMELELIEPDLYFDYAENAKKRYLEALSDMLTI